MALPGVSSLGEIEVDLSATEVVLTRRDGTALRVPMPRPVRAEPAAHRFPALAADVIDTARRGVVVEVMRGDAWRARVAAPISTKPDIARARSTRGGAGGALVGANLARTLSGRNHQHTRNRRQGC